MPKPVTLIALSLGPALKQEARDWLAQVSEVLFFDEMSPEELEARLPDVAVFVRYGFYKPFPDELFSRMTRLRLIQVMSAGTNFLDENPAIPARLAKQGARGANSAAVAEHAVALMLAAAKRLFENDRAIRQGIFDQKILLRSLEESTATIVGLGSIGQEVAKRLNAFGTKLYAIDLVRETREPVSSLRGLDGLKEALGSSDFVVLTLPLTRETSGLIGARELSWMHGDACLVNVGRGQLVQEEALYLHLRAHPRFTACIDVWWKYPPFKEEVIAAYFTYPFSYPFHLLDNVIMTPHVAALAGRATERMFGVVLGNVKRFLEESGSSRRPA